MIYCRYDALLCGNSGCAASWFWTFWGILLGAAIGCLIAGAVLVGEARDYNRNGWRADCVVEDCVDLSLKFHRYEVICETIGQYLNATLFDRSSKTCPQSGTIRSCFVRMDSDNKFMLSLRPKSYTLGIILLVPSCIWISLQILWLILSCLPECQSDIVLAEQAVHAALVKKQGYVQQHQSTATSK
jgi:hypothetical protein